MGLYEILTYGTPAEFTYKLFNLVIALVFSYGASFSYLSLMQRNREDGGGNKASHHLLGFTRILIPSLLLFPLLHHLAIFIILAICNISTTILFYNAHAEYFPRSYKGTFEPNFKNSRAERRAFALIASIIKSQFTIYVTALMMSLFTFNYNGDGEFVELMITFAYFSQLLAYGGWHDHNALKFVSKHKETLFER